MSKTLTKLNQLEYSTTPGSIIVTDATNEQVFVVPGSEGQILGIQSGVPAYGDANTYISFATQLEVDNGIVSDKPISTDTFAGTIIPSVIVGHDIATISNKTIRETVTTLTDNGNGTFTHVSENGTSTTIDFDNDATTVSDTSTVNLTLTGSDITADVNISTTLGNDITSDATGIFLDVQASETTTTITNTVVGNKIADYTDEDGIITPINETITSLSQDLLSGDIQFTDEAGSVNTAKVVSTDALNNITVGTDGGPFATIPVQIPKLMFDIPSQGEPRMENFNVIGNVGDNTSWNFNVYHAPIQDDRYQGLNPTIELMRYKRKHSNRTPNSLSSGSRNSKNIFVHPTHNNGVANTGKPYNGGGQFDNSGNPMPNRTTEWSYLSLQPWEKTNIQFEIKEWKGVGTNLASTGGAYPFPASLADYENLSNIYFKSTGTGKTGSNNIHKTELFAFRLRIDNPDTTDKSKPYIYGEMSEQFKVFPKIGNSGSEQLFYGWKVSRAHYQKNRS